MNNYYYIVDCKCGIYFELKVERTFCCKLKFENRSFCQFFKSFIKTEVRNTFAEKCAYLFILLKLIFETI